MNKLKITIIAGTIHPHKSPRSFRATELAIGMAKMGHDVTLYGLIGEYDYKQFERETGIKIKSLGKSYFGNIDSDGNLLSSSLMFRIFKGVLTRLFYNWIDYPRVEYFFKTKNALRKEKKFDYLITIAHPFAIHWGAAKFIKRNKFEKFNLWVADCGDPFMGDPDVKRKKLFLKPIEKFWSKYADFITVPVEAAKAGYYKEFHDKIEIIPQGLDFEKVETIVYKVNEVPTFLYSGVVYPGMRDPSLFLEYLCTLDINFKFLVYAPNKSIFENYQEKLGEKLEIRNYIPRLDLIKKISTVDFIINLKNNSGVQQPSKLIDYGLSKRPILDISTTITEEEISNFNEFINSDYKNQVIIKNLSQYNISNVCNKFIKLYERKINKE